VTGIEHQRSLCCFVLANFTGGAVRAAHPPFVSGGISLEAGEALLPANGEPARRPAMESRLR
jgi:hypothetical protein